MIPEELIDYLESKAKAHPLIPHDPDNGVEAFFCVDNPYDLEEFENAVRNSLKFPAMLVEQNDGILSDNISNNYTNLMRSSFMILDKRVDGEKIRHVRNRCFKIGAQIIIGIRQDQPADIIPGQRMNFNIRLAYLPIGPIDSLYYGYQFEIEFSTNFTFEKWL